MVERKLTAEEKAAADAEKNDEHAPATKPQPAAPAGRVRLAPPPFVTEFRTGDTVIPADGLEVDAATAQQLRETARRSGVTLREL
ncbi:hypothetical protein [Saccharopolyspora sp. NPDC002376]